MKLKFFYSLTLSLVLSLFSLTAFSQLYFEGLVYDGLGQPLLNNPSSVSVSPEGSHVYVISYDASAINIYERDGNGAMTYIESVINDVDGISGIGGAYDMLISPEGNHLYVAGSTDNSVAVFNRDVITGSLSFVEKQTSGMGNVLGLSGANSMVLSMDGNYLYVTGADDNAVVVFRRNVVSGALDFMQVLQDENGDVIDLNYPVSITVSPDGKNVYTASYGDNALTIFSRNENNGMLTFQNVVRDGIDGVSGMGGTYGVEVSADGATVYCIGIESHSIALFTRGTDGNLTFVNKYENGVDGVTGLMGVNAMMISPDGEQVFATGGNDNALVIFGRDNTTGALSFVKKFEEGLDGVSGIYFPLGMEMSPDMKNIYVPGFGGKEFAVFNMDDMGELTFDHSESSGTSGVDGLAGASHVAVSPDGKHIYVTGDADHSLAIFNRDNDTGMMTYSTMMKDGENGVDGLEGANNVVLSPDGKFAYTSGYWDNAMNVYERDANTGMLNLVSSIVQDENGVDGIYGINAIAVSPDGNSVYATGFWNGTMAMFQRNTSTNELEYVDFFRDGVDGVDGLNRANSVTVSADGKSVYVTGSSDDAIAVFSRDINTGMLTYIERYKNNVDGVVNMDAPFSAAVSPDGTQVYVATNRSDALVVFDRNAMDGTLTYRESHVNGVDEVTGLDGARSVKVSSDGLYVYIVSNGDNSVAVFRMNVVTGSLVFEKSRQDGVDGVNGIDFGYAVALSPNDRHIYVAGNGDNALALFSCTYFVNLEETICEGDSVVVNGSVYKNSGAYLDTFAIGSCINIINLDLEVQSKEVDLAVSICDGDAYEFAGVEYMASGSYTQAYTSSIGCDSVVTLNLEVVDSFEPEMISAEICSGEKYILGSIAYDNTGSYTQISLTDFGCEQKVILDLNVLPAYDEQITEVICEGEFFVFGTSNYTTTGIYTQMMQTSTGCDSIVTLYLYVLPGDGMAQEVNETICEGMSFLFGGENYTESGAYTQTLGNGDCSGEITLNLEVLPSPETQMIEVTICEGESYMLDGKPYSATGTYTSTLPSMNGCDSVTIMNLVVELAAEHQVLTLCAGETIQFGSEVIGMSGSYNYMETSANNCETVHTLNLTVLEELVGTADITHDTGQGNGEIIIEVAGGMAPYLFAWSNGKTTQNISFLDAGTYTVVITDGNGCETTYTYVVNLETSTGDLSDDFGITLFPNPIAPGTLATLKIESESAAALQISIYDIAGKQLDRFPMQLIAGENIQEINAPQSSGLYFINIYMEDGRTQSFRLAVQ